MILLYRRSRKFLAPNALQLFQRRFGTSERTLCIFSQDVAERPIALKVLKVKIPCGATFYDQEMVIGQNVKAAKTQFLVKVDLQEQ